VRSAPVDLYALLGVSRSATGADLRRAYRRLALQHHPDRAGPASAETFARIAEAYSMLSNLTARAAYDAHLFQREAAPGGSESGGGAAGGLHWNVSRTGWSATWQRKVSDLLPRLSGSLERLTAAGVARLDPSGTLELALSAGEAASGGTAIVALPLRILCPTCGGVASPRGVWCRRCEYAGQVVEEAPIRIAIPPAARDGLVLDAVGGRPGATAPRVRVRLVG
jgi:molecular chaperone DnaJ